MDDLNILDIPEAYQKLKNAGETIGFTMPSDLYIGTLLKTLVASKPSANILELGTGTGLSMAWIVDGMGEYSKLITIDNDPELIAIAQKQFESDKRLSILCEDGSEWLKNYQGPGFDLIFADAWPGKYYDLEETLDLLNPGGFYIIDDMNPADDWPEGHAEKAIALVDYLENREDLVLTKLNWSTGILIAAKIERNG